MSESRPSVDEVFLAALELSTPEERAGYLEKVCGDDADVRRRVERLLDAHPEVGEFMESPAVDVAPTVAQPEIAERPGTIIGRYKLLQQIGEGGFGVVFMAEQREPVRRKVALKIVKPGMDSREVIARFEAEQQALALMDHPHVARVLDASTTNTGRPYFVMELVKGVPLTEYCDKNGLSTQARLHLFIQVCRAVQYAHQKGIIHRDIKPSNILVTLHDGKPVPKIIDFGVAKAINQQLTEKTLFTSYGRMVGTPQYMSPEQAEMSGLDVDTRSDIYSLGIVLYELLTGTTPVDSERLRKAGYAEMQRLIRDEDPPRPSVRLSTLGERLTVIAKHRNIDPKRLRQQIRGELDWIVMKSLEKDRVNRYDSAAGLAADVERFLRGEAVEAHPPSVSYRLRKFARRNRLAVVLSLLVTAAMVFALAATSVGMIVFQRINQQLQSAKTEVEQEKNRADEKAIAANEARLELEQQSYPLIMMAAFQAWETANLEQARKLLLDARAIDQSNSSPDLAWRFLWERIQEGCPKIIDMGDHSRCIAYSPDGKLLAAGLALGKVVLYEFETSQLTHLPMPNPSAHNCMVVECLEFAPDGQYLLAGGSQSDSKGFITIWEMSTRRPAVLPVQHAGPVLGLAVSADGSLGASVSADGTNGTAPGGE